MPTLSDNATGRPVETTGFRVYYRSIRNNSAGVLPILTGLRMIAGPAVVGQPDGEDAAGGVPGIWPFGVSSCREWVFETECGAEVHEERTVRPG